MANVPPTEKPGPDIKVPDTAGWAVQIGPTVSGWNYGYFFSSPAYFYLSLGQGDPSVTYAWYQNQSGTWVAIPNNQQITAQGSSGQIYWAYSAPAGVTFKFLMGPA